MSNTVCRTTLMLFFTVLLHGCVPAWQALGVAADSLKASLGGYELWRNTERDKISDANIQKCGVDASCYKIVLESFDESQKPILACFKAAAPMIRAAESVVNTKDKAGSIKLLPEIAAKTIECGVLIGQRSIKTSRGTD